MEWIEKAFFEALGGFIFLLMLATVAGVCWLVYSMGSRGIQRGEEDDS
jgi:hypothetical protein